MQIKILKYWFRTCSDDVLQINECCEKAVLLNAKGEPRSGGGGAAVAKAAPAKGSEPKPVERPKTAAPASKPAGVCFWHKKESIFRKEYFVLIIHIRTNTWFSEIVLNY